MQIHNGNFHIRLDNVPEKVYTNLNRMNFIHANKMEAFIIMKHFRLLALALALVLSLGMLVACSAPNYAENNTEFIIGVSGPLTGGAAMYGEAVRNSAQMAVDEINAAGGLNGVMFKLVATDDKHDANNVKTNYSAMYEGGMQVSLGTVTTAPGLEYKNLAKDDNVFFLTPSASGDKIPEFDNGYQMCFADGNQGKVAAEFVNANYAGQTIGAFYKADEDYSKGIFQQFKDNLDPSVTVVATNFTDANATDFSTQIDTLKDYKFIFMPTYYDPASLFLKQAKDIIAPDAVYYGCDGFDGIDRIEGFDINEIPQAVTMLSHFNSKATEGKAKEYIDKYTEKYPGAPLNQFGASAYDCVYAIYGAMKAAIDAGKEIPVTISASDLCDILKDQFANGYTYTNGVTGASIKWESTGYVNKQAIQYVIKEANAAE